MSGEHRPRQHRLINPETASALLRRVVIAWDTNNDDACTAAIREARELLNPDESAKAE